MNRPDYPFLPRKLGKNEDATLPLVKLGVDAGKEMIMARLAIREPGPKYFHFPMDEEMEGTSQRGYDDIYFKGLVSEHKKIVKRNGMLREIWEPTKGVRNEPLDLRNYNLACIQSLKPYLDALAAEGASARVSEEKKSVKRIKPKKKKHVFSTSSIW